MIISTKVDHATNSAFCLLHLRVFVTPTVHLSKAAALSPSHLGGRSPASSDGLGHRRVKPGRVGGAGCPRRRLGPQGTEAVCFFLNEKLTFYFLPPPRPIFISLNPLHLSTKYHGTASVQRRRPCAGRPDGPVKWLCAAVAQAGGTFLQARWVIYGPSGQGTSYERESGNERPPRPGRYGSRHGRREGC